MVARRHSCKAVYAISPPDEAALGAAKLTQTTEPAKWRFAALCGPQISNGL
jgi:hypothetical protein